MTPSALTVTERRDLTHAGLFRTANPRQEPDLDLSFVVDLMTRRRPIRIWQRAVAKSERAA